MADTIQVVLWALGQQCPLRQGADWQDPATAAKALADCRTYSRLRKREGRGFGVYGDVCVTSVTSALPGDKNSRYDYPSSGFVLSSQFSSIGGLPSLHRLCGDCPANGDEGGIAGCVGSFHQALYSKELQEQLDRLIDRLGLASKLDAIFPQTRLQWFRFWIHSPIPVEGAALLQQLLEAVYEEDGQSYQSSGRSDYGQQAVLDAFVKSLERSVSSNISLHVSLTPPGHTDFGWYTIFSHCPQCKAAAPVERWKRKYRDEEIECAICRAKYSPAKTHSAKRDNWELKQLRGLLGQAEFEKFAASCLVAQGASEMEAARIVQKHEEGERARRKKWAQKTEASRRHQRFVQKVIYHGLNNLSPRNHDEPAWLFSPEETEEIFRRCENHGGRVLYISHVSESGEHDEFLQVSWPTSAKKALQKLREKGCNEKFSVIVKIPQEVVERWEEPQSGSGK
jgi:hypothetical protein